MPVVGDAFVRILPDTTQFNAQLKAQLAKATAAARVQVPVTVNTSGLVRSFQQAQAPAAAAASNVGKAVSQNIERNVAASSAAVRKLLQEFRNLLVVTAAVSVIGRPFAALISSGVKAAASIEQTRVAFTGLLGSTEESEDAIERLREFAKVTPFEFPGLVSAAQRFIGLGKTVEETLDILRTVGDATSAIGADQDAINRVTLAFTQIQASGRLLAQDLNQITQALPNVTRGAVFEQLAKDMGKSTTEIRDLQEQGAIPAEQALSSLLAVMRQIPGAEGAMERQSKTLIGVFSNLKDAVRQALEDSFTPLTPILTKSIQQAQPVIESNLRDIGTVFAEAATEFLPLLLESFAELTPVLIDLTRSFLALAPAFSGVTALAVALAPAMEAFADVVNAIPASVIQLVGVFAALRLATRPLASQLDLTSGSLGRFANTSRVFVANSAGVVTATTQSRQAFSRLGSSLAGLVNPTNAALLGAGLLLTAFANARRKTLEHKQAVDELTRAYLDNTQAALADTQASVQQAISKAGLTDLLREINVGFDEFTQFAREGASGAEALVSSLTVAGVVTEQFAQIFFDAVGAGKSYAAALELARASSDELSTEALKLLDVLGEQIRVQQESAKGAAEIELANKKITEAQLRQAESQNTLSDGTIDYVGVLKTLNIAMPEATTGAGALGGALGEVGTAAERAAARFEAIDKALKEVQESFDRTVGATLDATDANADFQDSLAGIADLQQKLSEELKGTAEEHQAVADAISDLADANDDLVEAQQKATEAAEESANAHAELAEIQATEGVRAARQLADAERELEQSKHRLIELENDLAEATEKRTKAEDPVKLARLANLRKLLGSIQAAPPSFIEKIEDDIAELEKEVGPKAVKALDLQIRGLQLDIQEGQDAVVDGTDDVVEAQRQQREGTDDLVEAQKKAKDAAEGYRDAQEGVSDATDKVAEQQRSLNDAYKELEPNQAEVAKLQRDIEKAQRDSIRAAFDLASAITQTSGVGAEAIRATLGAEFDKIIAKFPVLQEAFSSLPENVRVALDIELNPPDLTGIKKSLESLPEFLIPAKLRITGVEAVNATVEAILPDFLTPKRAQAGGVFGAGDIVTVGEVGPETFVPERAGRVLSHRDSLEAVAQGIRDAITEALGAVQAAASGPTVSVVAPSTDARDVVDGVIRGLRAEQFLRGTA